MTDIIFAVVGFLVFGIFIAFALWFGVAVILFVFVSSVLLALFIVIRSYYLRWRFNNAPLKPTKSPIKEAETTIIDVEYHDISEK